MPARARYVACAACCALACPALPALPCSALPCSALLCSARRVFLRADRGRAAMRRFGWLKWLAGHARRNALDGTLSGPHQDQRGSVMRYARRIRGRPMGRHRRRSQ
ncbi:hypothetical protein BGX38DRAFT_1171676 [Terfezia claveryi]|nr:hypothetical protein BGX38DRAFT_1171676 [Terfezia claveryi]